MPLFRHCCQAFANDNEVVIPLLKFFADFVYNRSQRISFECSSPSGILIFKEASALLHIYSNTQMTAGNSIPEDKIYELKYKGYYICMNILGRSLAGNYCNFGVMSYYKDDAVDCALGAVIKMALSIRISDLLAYPKLGTAYFSLLEILFTNHCHTLSSLETSAFLHLTHSMEEAIKSVVLNQQSVCSATAAIGHLASYYFSQTQKNTPQAAMLTMHFRQDPDLFARVLNDLFSVALYEECSNQWSMSRPMLPLILVSPGFLDNYKQKLLTSVTADKHAKLHEAFAKLMEGVEQNLEAKSRDKFTQNLAVFRQVTKLIL
jgi:exportin-7